MSDTRITVGTDVITFRDRSAPQGVYCPYTNSSRTFPNFVQNYYATPAAAAQGLSEYPDNRAAFQSVTVDRVGGVQEQGDDHYTPGIDQILINGQPLDLDNPIHRRAFEYFSAALGIRSDNYRYYSYGSQLFLFNEHFRGAFLPQLKAYFDTAEAARQAVAEGDYSEAAAKLEEYNWGVDTVRERAAAEGRATPPYQHLTPSALLTMQIIGRQRGDSPESTVASLLGLSLDHFYNSRTFTFLFRPAIAAVLRNSSISGLRAFYDTNEAWVNHLLGLGLYNLPPETRNAYAVFFGAPEEPRVEPVTPAPVRVARNQGIGANPYRTQITIADEASLAAPPVAVEIRPSAAAAPSRRPHRGVPRNRNITINLNM